ncbi:GATA-domain-containing protein [Lentinus brumalis]|uniref:GATA-domain-containing protein n=1 Tax=Lentinus brumalis TaxID=2498619 RepID=A0A371DV56_9APHY|nr:GATA-domain-containing protein [Polyporus brumalis]
MADPAAVPVQQPLSPAREIPVFEFTKRKRWADLLITELNDTVIFVLSETCQVWYCGNAVTELLGWRDDELVDADLIDLMNADDRGNFRAAFTESVRSKTEMLAYARLQCKNEFNVSRDYTSAPKEVLFEIRGRPHHLPDTDEFKCYFAMAQPYPSRNTAMLNTFLELKMEHERLQQRIVQLRAQSQALEGSTDGFFSTSDNFGATEAARTGYDVGAVPDGEDDGPRKKVKRLAAEQHVCVTCGRTDSPEWRKGPLGPKTLCNACGLRWAKKARKTGDEGEGDAGQNGPSTVF